MDTRRLESTGDAQSSLVLQHVDEMPVVESDRFEAGPEMTEVFRYIEYRLQLPLNTIHIGNVSYTSFIYSSVRVDHPKIMSYRGSNQGVAACRYS